MARTIEPGSPDGTRRRAARRSADGWVIVVGLALALSALHLLALAIDPADPLELSRLALFVALAVALLIHRRTLIGATLQRQHEGQGRTRMLQGLSRSMSVDAVVGAVVDELRLASGADHVVVARAGDEPGQVEATLVSVSASVPVSRTRLAADVLDPGRADAVTSADAVKAVLTERISHRVRRAYGLKHTLAEPLVADGRVVGALVLSRRLDDRWPEETRDLLGWASTEVSAALARAYALRDAETRATIDALTGLPNRRSFEELTRTLSIGRRATDVVGILMIDVDNFKSLNDRYGHATGDEVLRAVARAIAATIRASDTPARYGGEEFVVVLRETAREQATDIAERIRMAVGRLSPEKLGIEAPVSVSVGVAVASAATRNVTALVERADRALYAAKRAGRDQVLVA